MPAARLSQVSYELRCSDGPATEGWGVHRFRMREGLSEPYQLLVDVVTRELEVEFEDLLGADIELVIVRGEIESSVHGIVVGVDWLGVSADHLLLRLDIRPAFALLAQRIDSRIWQDQSVLGIVDTVLAALGDYGRSYAKGGLTRGTTKREYCVQYRESDLDFVHRLLEEEGISYVFVQDADRGQEVLTLVDEVKQLVTASNVDGDSLFPVIANNPEQSELESIQALEWRRRLTSTGALRRDFDWVAPNDLISAQAGEADARARERRVYTHGQRRFVADDLRKRAGDRTASQNLPGTRGTGRGNATGFHAGLRFKLEGHELGQAGEELVLVRVEHEGHNPAALPSLESQRDAEGGYRNTFECMPSAAELRPAMITPKPRVHGPQTAIVCGPAGEEIEVDDKGRIHVQFYFQEKPKYDTTSSCWVRVAHNWAGAGWGFQFIPRIGMEVVVEFLEGNPDRPLVSGCVYNGVNPPPYTLPDDKTRSGIKTNSSPGGGGSNELRFEDAAGSEEIYLHGQKDWTIAIEHDKNQTVGNDESRDVGHDKQLTIGNDRTKSVGHDEKVKIGNDLTLTVGHDQIVTIGHDQTVTIAHDQITTIANNASESVAVNKVIAVGAAMQISVVAALNESVGAARAEEIGGAKAVVVGADHGERAGGSRSIETGKDFVVKAGAAGTIEAQGALGIMTADKLSMTAEQDLMIASKTAAMVEAADKLTLKCGKAQIVLESSGDVTITGAKITIKGSSDVKIKGAKVDNN